MLFPSPGTLEDNGVGLADTQSIASMPVCYGMYHPGPCKLWLMKKNHQQGHDQRPAPHLSLDDQGVWYSKVILNNTVTQWEGEHSLISNQQHGKSDLEYW